MTTARDRGLLDFKSFAGTLRAGGDSVSVQFRARVDGTGDVELDFDPIPRTKATQFIGKIWDREDGTVCEFELTGKAADGTEFETISLSFNNLGTSTDRAGSTLKPVGRCGQAIFRRKLCEPAPHLFMRMHLRGFQSFDVLSHTCPLGLVAMSGVTKLADTNDLCGRIELESQEGIDLTDWKMKAELLLEHVRRVMSFAASSVLQDPVVEYFSGDNLEVVVTSRTEQARGQIRTFHFLDQEPIFRTAVESFFNPPLLVEKLFLVIEWFAIDATYNEIRLANAMTALEMLLDSNLPKESATIQPAKDFDKKTRPFLKRVIQKCLRQLPNDQTSQILKDMNEKLGDLNRKSLLNKLEALRKLWSVPFDGVTEDMLRGAKRARDHIIHRGQYYNDDPTQEDLWRHVTVVREIVVRFILTALGYRGRYVSHLGGYHDAQFPPINETQGDE